ncbi:monovalent cation/H(+) antiporter subunit G [Citricoccus sp.]|uniref:cation:proton antiporter n=2 Tax=Citricoccus TaxID=169133 RepID=UPI002C6E7008|nr:monovalent cation/H(+) antiporter subunit G [Citricoccus sp.]HRO95131.1 monovalent cation/H(+) antiporter subunit G [Citricoccus sp.]
MEGYQILAAVLILGGALLVLLSAVAMVRARDALQMMNVFSPATAMGLPLMVAGVFAHLTGRDGFDWWVLLVSLVTIFALVIVSSLASNTLARAVYQSGAPVDPQTHPQDLAGSPRTSPDA